VKIKWHDLIWLAFWLGVTFGVAFISSQYQAGPWYEEIARPTWTPPGWIFGPVWSFLYLSMGVAAWLVWRQRTSKPVTMPLTMYGLQLVANGLWSWIFFGQRMIGVALIDLLLLVALVSITMVLFFRVNRLAGALLIPYLLWISFAAFLNFSIWRLN